MNTLKWFFVYDPDGVALGAFPTRDLAENYTEGVTVWEIREQPISF
jgi:hypothetical protein